MQVKHKQAVVFLITVTATFFVLKFYIEPEVIEIFCQHVFKCEG